MNCSGGSMVHLVPWLACLIGWACRLMLGRQLSCSAAHARQRRPRWRRFTGDRWRERDLPTGSGRRDGLNEESTGRRWRLDICQGTWRHNMGERKRIYGFGKPHPRGKNRGRTAWPSRPREAHGAARLRDARDERWQGRRCGSIFCTGMSGKPWSFWRRETSPVHGSPYVTCWLPGVHWKEGTLPSHSAPGGRSGREGG